MGTVEEETKELKAQAEKVSWTFAAQNTLCSFVCYQDKDVLTNEEKEHDVAMRALEAEEEVRPAPHFGGPNVYSSKGR